MSLVYYHIPLDMIFEDPLLDVMFYGLIGHICQGEILVLGEL